MFLAFQPISSMNQSKGLIAGASRNGNHLLTSWGATSLSKGILTCCSNRRRSLSFSDYSNWDLSTDRANAARRLLWAGGVPPERVVELRGFADHQALEGAAPDSPRNRRVSIVVRLA
jgi:hypothetical protein